MAGSPVKPRHSRVVRGQVMHRRQLPFEHRFVYPVFFLLIHSDEFDQLDSWLFGVNRRRPLAIHFADHGDTRDPRLWVREQLVRYGIHDCPGALWLQTFPRLFGYLFNPVSFWYCERADGSIGAVVAEVNNTFGDRCSYVLRLPDGARSVLRAAKRMHVSPFFPTEGEYRFRFNVDFDAPRVSIDYYRGEACQLNTRIFGQARPLTPRSLLASLWRQPLLTLGVTVRIHYQALRLWLKGGRFHQRPRPSPEEIPR